MSSENSQIIQNSIRKGLESTFREILSVSGNFIVMPGTFIVIPLFSQVMSGNFFVMPLFFQVMLTNFIVMSIFSQVLPFFFQDMPLIFSVELFKSKSRVFLFPGI